MRLVAFIHLPLTLIIIYSFICREISLPNVHLTYASVSKLYNDIMLTYDKKFRPFYGGKKKVALFFTVVAIYPFYDVVLKDWKPG